MSNRTNRKTGKLLLLGSGGQVGQELLTLLRAEWEITAPRSAELDLTNEQEIRRTVRDLQPRWILNAAAYTAVDRAEAEPQTAFAINAEALRILGEEAQACGASVIHYSTDYVFSGTDTTPRRESDPARPSSVYGASKLAGEQALAASGAPHFTFRTSWVYSTHGKNFMLTILDLARRRDELNIVSDQVGAPTYAPDLARLTRHAIQRTETAAAQEAISLVSATSRLGGLYHACNSGETNWFGFAQEFLALARKHEPRQHWAKLNPIPTIAYPTPAKRPADSRLDCSLLTRQLGFAMPDWRASVVRAMQDLYAS
jgi:dTDP-4-dehydrorhamnose reductase